MKRVENNQLDGFSLMLMNTPLLNDTDQVEVPIAGAINQNTEELLDILSFSNLVHLYSDHDTFSIDLVIKYFNSMDSKSKLILTYENETTLGFLIRQLSKNNIPVSQIVIFI